MNTLIIIKIILDYFTTLIVAMKYETIVKLSTWMFMLPKLKLNRGFGSFGVTLDKISDQTGFPGSKKLQIFRLWIFAIFRADMYKTIALNVIRSYHLSLSALNQERYRKANYSVACLEEECLNFISDNAKPQICGNSDITLNFRFLPLCQATDMIYKYLCK